MNLANTLAFISMPGGWEWLIVALIGLLLFGRRLPEVGANIAKTIVGFKREINTANAQIDQAAKAPAPDEKKLETDERSAPRQQDQSPYAAPSDTPATNN